MKKQKEKVRFRLTVYDILDEKTIESNLYKTRKEALNELEDIKFRYPEPEDDLEWTIKSEIVLEEKK